MPSVKLCLAAIAFAAAGFAHGENYQGLWWNPDEPGWGVSIAHQGDILFASWFTYDVDTGGMWLYFPNAAKTETATYSGALYRNAGPPFSASTFDPTQVRPTQIGTGTFVFADSSNAAFTYTVNGITQSKTITRFNFSSPVPTCVAGGSQGSTVNYTDVWWRDPPGSESGWGVTIAHQGDILFVSWFTYASDGRGMWLYAPRATRIGDRVYSGDLMRNRGPPFSADPFDSTQVIAERVGTLTMTFSEDTGKALFTNTAYGFDQSEPLTRFVFSSPPTVCNGTAPSYLP